MSKEKKPKKPKSLKKVVTIVVIVMIVIFLLFPRVLYFRDGGSKMYCSLFGFIRVEQLHKIYDEAGYSYYEIGTVVTVFGIEVFNNAHVDYEHGHPLQHSPEVEAVNKEIDKILN